ncbi:MAG: hypothetical protein ABIF09_03540, partial [Gemmatimonadota bacterium]
MTAPRQEHHLVLTYTQKDTADLDGRQGDGGHDHHVEEDAQIEGPEPPEEGGRLPRVPKLVEGHVGQRSRPPPELRVEEDRTHPSDDEGPPEPVLAHAPGP